MLRSVAVVFVVLDHSLKFFRHPLFFGVDLQWLGKLGVMFFFVHTCMVLMLSLERTDGKLSRAHFIGYFYLRRAFRIYPLSIFAICFVLLFSIPSAEIDYPFHIATFVPTKLEVVLNLLLMQNMHMFRNIIAVLWSLPFEVQMYVLLPFIYLWLAKPGRLAALLVFWAAGLALAYLVQPHSLFLAQFIPGVIAYVMLKRVKRPLIPSFFWPLFIVALTLTFLFSHPSFLAGGLACLILGASIPFFKETKVAFVNSATHHLAKYSYGVYLSHMFCLWFAFIHLPGPRLLQGAVFAALLVAVPVMLFHAVEDPMIRAGGGFADRLFRLRKTGTFRAQVQREELEATASGN